MKVLNMIVLASAFARATGEAFVIIETGEIDVPPPAQLFPTLDDDDLAEMQGGEVALRFASDAEAQDGFNEICRGIVDARAAGCDDGEIIVRYVGRIGESPVITTANTYGFGGVDRRSHFFVEGKLEIRQK